MQSMPKAKASTKKVKKSPEYSLVTPKPRYFGLVKVKRGAKMCWVSHESKNGWSLGLALGKRTVWLKGLRFASIDQVKRTTEMLSTVFSHTRNSKTIPVGMQD